MRKRLSGLYTDFTSPRIRQTFNRFNHTAPHHKYVLEKLSELLLPNRIHFETGFARNIIRFIEICLNKLKVFGIKGDTAMQTSLRHFWTFCTHTAIVVLYPMEHGPTQGIFFLSIFPVSFPL